MRSRGSVLMWTILVVTLTALVAVFAYWQDMQVKNSRAELRKGQVVRDMDNMRLQLEFYYDRTRKWPSTLEEAIPGAGEDFTYSVTSDGKSYELCTTLEVPEGASKCVRP